MSQQRPRAFSFPPFFRASSGPRSFTNVSQSLVHPTEVETSLPLISSNTPQPLGHQSFPSYHVTPQPIRAPQTPINVEVCGQSAHIHSPLILPQLITFLSIPSQSIPSPSIPSLSIPPPLITSPSIPSSLAKWDSRFIKKHSEHLNLLLPPDLVNVGTNSILVCVHIHLLFAEYLSAAVETLLRDPLCPKTKARWRKSLDPPSHLLKKKPHVPKISHRCSFLGAPASSFNRARPS